MSIINQFWNIINNFKNVIKDFWPFRNNPPPNTECGSTTPTSRVQEPNLINGNFEWAGERPFGSSVASSGSAMSFESMEPNLSESEEDEELFYNCREIVARPTCSTTRVPHSNVNFQHARSSVPEHHFPTLPVREPSHLTREIPSKSIATHPELALPKPMELKPRSQTSLVHEFQFPTSSVSELYFRTSPVPKSSYLTPKSPLKPTTALSEISLPKPINFKPHSPTSIVPEPHFPTLPVRELLHLTREILSNSTTPVPEFISPTSRVLKLQLHAVKVPEPLNSTPAGASNVMPAVPESNIPTLNVPEPVNSTPRHPSNISVAVPELEVPRRRPVFRREPYLTRSLCKRHDGCIFDRRAIDFRQDIAHYHRGHFIITLNGAEYPK